MPLTTDASSPPGLGDPGLAEFVQADRGLGFVIMTTYRTLNMPRLWAALIISALIGLTFFAIISFIERLVIPWHSSMRTET